MLRRLLQSLKTSGAILDPDNAPASPSRGLRFKPDGTFRIIIFEDLHFGENAWDQFGAEQDKASINVINSILDRESPELVVLNGDLITGENSFLENGTEYIDQIVGPLVDRGLSWASTYGNHDSDFNLSREGLLARERRWPNARTTQMVAGPDAGVSNYFLPVFGPAGEHSGPELILWFFDSRGGFRFQQQDATGRRVGQPNWVDFSVVNWFRQTHAVLMQRWQRTIPSLAFVHIPTYASQALQLQPGKGPHPNRQPGINDDVPVSPQAQGWCPDGRDDGTCAYGGQDIPFMHAISTTPGLMALFSGHDHGDTWCYKWNELIPGMTVAGNGINLCFGQHSGYGGYGSWIRGARMLRLSLSGLKKMELDTWIRLENGDVVGEVTLNATYGKDHYPKTPNTKTGCKTCNYSVVTSRPGTKQKNITYP